MNNMMKTLEPLQVKIGEIKSKPDYVKEVLAAGTAYCRTKAAQTMAEVFEKTGLAKWGMI